MKRFLLYCMVGLLGTLAAHAQIPVTPISNAYEFTNGSLADSDPVNPAPNLMVSGGTATFTTDHLTDPNSAYQFNATKLTANTPVYDEYSMSFWIKTTTVDPTARVVFDQSEATGNVLASPPSEIGFHAYLQNGQIKYQFGIRHLNTMGMPTLKTYGNSSTNSIADGNWHHVVFTLAESQNMVQAGLWTTTFNHRVFIDGALDSQNISSFQGTNPNSNGPQGSTPLTFADNSMVALPASQRYQDEIDDFYIYDYPIGGAQVLELYNYDRCRPTTLNVDMVSSTTADLSWDVTPGQTQYDIAYVESGMPLSSATEVLGITTGSTQLTGLLADVSYDVYIKGYCGSRATTYGDMQTFTTRPDRFYVDVNATGANNGTTWADAFTSLETALQTVTDNRLFIAQGVYTSQSTGTSAFEITSSNSLYGGFSGNGTETMLSQRDPDANPTILTADKNGNDVYPTAVTNPSLDENFRNVIKVTGADVIIDGVTIQGGNATGGSGENQGSGVLALPSSNNVLINDCVLQHNRAISAGTITMDNTDNNSLTVTNSIVRNNLARLAVGVYFTSTSFSNTPTGNSVQVVNSLFHNNEVTDFGSAVGLSSVMWLRTGPDFDLSTSIVNCTFADNTWTGSGNAVDAPVIATSHQGASMSLELANNVFWNNLNASGVGTVVHGAINNQSTAQTVTATNNLDPDNFSNLPAAVATLTSDPLLADSTNDDYTLNASSPAIDSGDNAAIIATGVTTDLAGNARIVQAAVDLGAYERDNSAAIFIPDTALKAELVANAIINTNNDSEIQFSEAIAFTGTLTAANLGFSDPTGLQEFVNATGLDLSGNAIVELVLDPFGQLTSIDLSNNASMERLQIQNGNNMAINTAGFNLTSVPLLGCVQVDDPAYATATWTNVDPQIGFAAVCERPIYVNAAVATSGDGSSWSTAYNDLRAALVANPTATSFWVAQGTYFPGALRSDKLVLLDNQTIYGGFAGTEAVLDQRDVQANVTIISGDYLQNDSYQDDTTFLNSTVIENAYGLFNIQGSNTAIDGFILTGTTADGAAAADKSGNIVSLSAGYTKFELRNCEVRENYVEQLGLIRSLDVQSNGVIKVTNNTFTRNKGRGAVVFYARAAVNRIVDVTFENNLIVNNRTVNTNGSNADRSMVWLRQDIGGGGAAINAQFINDTYADNNMVQSGRVIQAGRLNGGIVNVQVFNSIFHNNFHNTAQSQVEAVGPNGTFSFPTTTQVRNSISTLGFPSIADKQNTIMGDPLFNGATGMPFYGLQLSSPALDTGDTNVVNTVTDVSGNARISGTAVDMGAYERLFDPCAPSMITYANVDLTQLDVNWQPGSLATTWEIAYHASSQPFSAATIVQNVSSPMITLTGLQPNTEYAIYVRGICSGTPTGWVQGPLVKTLRGPVYVAADATGANDGSSWADAYVDLNDALADDTDIDIWVKAGTYTPGSARTAMFTIQAGQQLLGGFNGSETMVSQRDIVANLTILSGDQLGNDSPTLSINDATRNDNNYRLLNITGDGTLIDGFTITGAHANGPAGATQSGAVALLNASNELNLRRCVVTKNAAVNFGLIRSIDAGRTQTINLDRIQFTDNIARGAVLYYGRASANNTISTTILNSLIDNNQTLATSGGAVDKSLVWLRQDNGGTQDLTIINSTIADNTFGSSSPVIRAGSSGGRATDITIQNSILWNNTFNGNDSPAVGTGGVFSAAGLRVVRNSLSADGFSTMNDTMNVISSDPDFSGPAAGDYTLLTSSPAIDYGENVFNPLMSDLAGNARVVNNIIDLGAYEFDQTLSAGSVIAANADFVLYPNPASSLLNVDTGVHAFAKAQIINLQGQVVFESDSQSMDVSSLATGTYLVQVRTIDGSVQTKRFVKR